MKLPATLSGLEKLPVRVMSLGELSDALGELDLRRDFGVWFPKTDKSYGYDEWHFKRE